MKIFKEKQYVAAGLFIAGTVLFVVSLFTDVVEGGADNYAHFNISRWVFKHPFLIFDLWGKPIFSLLSAPFAQFGLIGVRLFNIICGLFTAWFGYKTALKLQMKNGWISAVLIVSVPIYLAMMTSGMTEILFSLILVLSVYLFFSGRFIWSSVVVSFLFLIRTEGLAFELLFFAGYLLKRHYRAIPFLATGFILFSIIGSIFLFNDFFWLIHNRPYARGGDSVYGSGSFWHYLFTMPFYFGYPAIVFLFAGTLFVIYNWAKEKFNLRSGNFLVLLIVGGCLYGYLGIHSFLWWKGETSVGLLRVMAAVAPLAALLSHSGLNGLIGFIRHKALTKAIMATICILFSLAGIRYYYKMTTEVNLSRGILEQATSWLKKSGVLRHKLIIHDPYFAYSTGVDPWDANLLQTGFSSNEFPESGLPDSTVFIWDAHFSANEGQMPLEKIRNNQNFKFVRKFEPKDPFTVLGGHEYKIVVFMKLAAASQDDSTSHSPLGNVPETVLFRKGFDFETATGDPEIDSRIEAGKKNHDSRYFRFGSDKEFSPGFIITADQLNSIPQPVFSIGVDLYSDEKTETRQFLLVFSVEKDNKSLSYEALDLTGKAIDEGNWIHFDQLFEVPSEIEPGYSVKIYIWNTGRKQIYLDNFMVEISESDI